MSQKIGAVWKKSGKNGEFLSGYIQWPGMKVSIVMFKVKDRKSDKMPEYDILFQEDNDRKEQTPQAEPAYSDDIPI